ncbi:MAG TPA: hypothetical protein ENH41_00340 [Candidatus Omnitrophica bacterium]|nr:hypothetical protein [Candidatus Omnitrophota bacterium]
MFKLPVIRFFVLSFCLVFMLSGCSVFMAAKQPGKKDISLFKVGTSRSLLIAEFGAPIISEERNGKKYELFKFTQGYGGASKVGRAMFHGAADVFTLGLWEVVGTPTEMVFDGSEMAYEVSYDADNRVETVANLKKK